MSKKTKRKLHNVILNESAICACANRKEVISVLHKILAQISFGTGFIGLFGLVGTIEQAVTNMTGVYSAIALIVISAGTGYWSYLESGQKNRPRHRGK